MFTLSYTEHDVDKRYALDKGETSVGRSPDCGLVIDDARISRRHALFVVKHGRCLVRDIGSRNGTYRNGDLVTETEVANGDIVMLGHLPVQVSVAMDDRLSLSDRQLHLEGDTIYRPVAETAESPSTPAIVEPQRLLDLVGEIGRTLVDVADLQDILNRVTELVFTAVAAERCFLLLDDGDAGELAPRVVRNRDGTTPEGAAVSRTILSTVMRDRVAMLATNARLDPRLDRSDSILEQDVRSFMCAPLWNQRAVIGALYADTRQTGRFSEAELELFGALSNYAAVAIERARLSARVQEEQRRRARLERYHSPGVVERILGAGAEGDIAFIAQEREVTVLFADIVGFTAWSEGLSPNAVAQRLNRCLACMSDAIFAEEGTLDKFIGDAVLAVFGAPLDQPDHAVRAVRTARGIRAAIARLNTESAEVPLEVRIAINTGIAMTGDVGSATRREYTVLGDVVNTASRIQSGVAEPGQIIVTQSTYERITGQIEASALGPVSLRGREAQVEVYLVGSESS